MSKEIGSVLTNKYLEEKGLLSIADHYNKKHHTIQLQFVGL